MILLPVVLIAAAAVASGPVVRISPDQSVITAEAQSDAPLVAHNLSFVTSDGGKVKPSFILRCGDATWKWDAARAFELRRPAGECTVTAQVADYRTAESPLPPKGKVTLRLDKLPILSGVVTDAETSTPVAGADIVIPGGDAFAVSDADGRFRVAVEEKWPQALRVLAPGRAAKVVAVPKTIADTALTVALSRGGSVTVTLAPPLGEEPVKWEVRRPGKHGAEGVMERAGELDAGQKETILEGLEAGTYHFMVKGEGPLQRAVVPFTVRDGEASAAEVTIAPAVVDLEVRFAGQQLGGVSVDINFGRRERLWQATVNVDAEGRATEEIWQRGYYTAYVKKPPLIKYSRAAHDLQRDGVNSWIIDVPDRSIRGRIVDEAGKPIGSANVALYSTSHDQVTVASSERTAADGSFQFSAVTAGKYYLKVSHGRYQALQTPVYQLPEDTSLDTRELVMLKNAGREATIVNARGLPMPAVAVYIATHKGERPAGLTDDKGRVLLPVSSFESGLVIAIPRSGSLGIARFRSLLEAEHAPIEVKVPDGTASLELRAESTGGEPIGELAFMVAIDGTFLPLDAAIALNTVQGLPLRTGKDGRATWTRLPPARYEIWPLASRADYDAVRSAARPPAAVSVMLTPGHHTATFKFKPKE